MWDVHLLVFGMVCKGAGMVRGQKSDLFNARFQQQG
jgi:hypothetical protein